MGSEDSEDSGKVAADTDTLSGWLASESGMTGCCSVSTAGFVGSADSESEGFGSEFSSLSSWPLHNQFQIPVGWFVEVLLMLGLSLKENFEYDFHF